MPSALPLTYSVGRVFVWYGPLASLSVQVAGVASDPHGKNNGVRKGQDHSMGGKNANLSFFPKSYRFSRVDE